MESSDPAFWQDQGRAQGVMHRLGELKGSATNWRGLEHKVKDALEMVSLSVDEDEASLQDEIVVETEKLEARFEEMEFELLLGGEYEKGNAFLAIHAGAGGTEAQDWAEMLLRMYLRWAERRGYEAAVIDSSPGEYTGIKSVLISVN